MKRAAELSKERTARFTMNRATYVRATQNLGELEHQRFDAELLGAMMALSPTADFTQLCTTIQERAPK